MLEKKRNSISDIIKVTGLVLLLILVADRLVNKPTPNILQALRKDVGSKTVMLTGSRGGGTGFFVSAPSGKTYIMTNAHVCTLKNLKGEININLPNGDVVKRKVLQEYNIHDLCLVENIEGFDGIDVADNLTVGESAYIVGHPKLFPLVVAAAQYIGPAVISIFYGYNAPTMVIPPFQTMKAKSGDEGLVGTQTLLTSQFIGYSRGGNSGSAIVNSKGELVSVLFAGSTGDNQETYAVPLSFIKTFLKYR